MGPDQERQLLVQLATVSTKLEHVANSLEGHSGKLDRLVELQQQTQVLMSKLEDRSLANKTRIDELVNKERLRSEDLRSLRKRIADLEKEFNKGIRAEIKARNAVRAAIASAITGVGSVIALYFAK